MSNINEIKIGLKQIQSVKKLRRKRNGILLKNKCTIDQIAYLYQIPTFIFASETYKDMKTLIGNIIDFYITENIPLEEQFDFIVINNHSIIFNSRKNSYAYISDDASICFAETNENTLAAFLFWMNKVPKSAPDISANVLSFYIDETLFHGNLRYFPDLNQRYNSHFQII